ncbi:endonuclease [Histidinibacterium lentulum]|uniref:Endonuclease n=1 Tax=Histidinibacterium lentulum TaxID=2480588 RepID=A0A3N2QSZ2_9RHOB|nr:endonuclease [Histidinibacterium lentulum]
MTAVSWNIHRARGKDGRVDPERVLAVLGEEVCPPGTADILALQEADEEPRPHRGILDIAGVEAATGLGWAHGDPALRWSVESHGFLGAILFLPTAATIRHGDLIDLPGRCHRGAVSLEIGLKGRTVRVVTTHLSLGQPLRLVQMRTIGQYLMRRPRMQTILLGDLNEWRPWGGLAFRPGLTLLPLEGPARPSFPATRPLLPLDRVLSAPGCVEDLEVLDGPGIRAASDHRPVRARVRAEG